MKTKLIWYNGKYNLFYLMTSIYSIGLGYKTGNSIIGSGNKGAKVPSLKKYRYAYCRK
jgi:hypothetical protein